MSEICVVIFMGKPLPDYTVERLCVAVSSKYNGQKTVLSSNTYASITLIH